MHDAQARAAAAIWESRLKANPKDFESAWKLSRVFYWLGNHEPDEDARRKALEKQVATRRKALERRAQKEIARVQKEIARQPLVKRAQKQADTLRAGAQSRLEAGVAGVLGAFPLATKGEIDRIDRKLRSIDRKLREMEKSQGAAA